MGGDDVPLPPPVSGPVAWGVDRLEIEHETELLGAKQKILQHFALGQAHQAGQSVSCSLHDDLFRYRAASHPVRPRMPLSAAVIPLFVATRSR